MLQRLPIELEKVKIRNTFGNSVNEILQTRYSLGWGK